MPSYTPTSWNEGAAPGISAAELNRIETGVDGANAAIDAHDDSRDGHPVATSSLDGLMSGADKATLDAIDVPAWAPVTEAGVIINRSVGTGEVLLESFAIVIPSSWNTYDVVVTANLAITSANNMEIYNYFDGLIQVEQLCYGPQNVCLSFRVGGRTATGSRIVRVYGKSLSGTASIAGDGQLTCVAYRRT